jgi:NADPH:quinone reductase-like Zn-dependent oxidoreductase
VDGAVDAAMLHMAFTLAVRDGGGFVTVRRWAGDGRGRLRFLPVIVRDYAENTAALDRLARQVEEGLITLRVARTFPAERADEAHRLLEAGGVRGRVVLTF